MISELQRKGTAPKGVKMKIQLLEYEVEITAKDVDGAESEERALASILNEMAKYIFEGEEQLKAKHFNMLAHDARQIATALAEAAEKAYNEAKGA